MKKIILTLLLLFALNSITAQVNEKELLKKTEDVVANIHEEKPNGWVKKGMFTVLLNQASFTNWLAGGQNAIAGNIALKYDFNYKSDTWTWDNKFSSSYGLTKLQGQEMQKTDDRVEFNSLLGKKASGEWYYSAFFNFKTQYDSGFDPADKTVKISHFFSPAYFQLGVGMLWKKSDNLKVNIAPATTKLILVDKDFTVSGESFGVLQGDSSRLEFGAALNGYYKFNIMENISAENILNLYSNYLEKPQNVDVDYTLNIVMKVNKFMSTNFSFQTIFDDNAHAPGYNYAKVQTREVIGVGINYGF